MLSGTQKWQFSTQHNSSSQLTGELKKKVQSGPDKGMQKSSEHSAASAMPASETNRSKDAAAQRNESCEIVGLFMDVFVADAAAVRTKPRPDVHTELSPKLVRALLYLVQRAGTP